MSLKAFHIFFITLSVLLCLGVAGWNGSAWMAGGSTTHLAESIGWVLAGTGLMIYGIRFLRKYRSLGFYALLLVFAAENAQACAVCFGNPESPMTKSVVAGIWVMLGCIGTLLAAFAGLFLYWTYRSYHVHLYREEGATN